MKIGDYVYWCKYKGMNEYGSPEYYAPVAIKTRLNYFTCQPITEYNDIKVFGDDSTSTWKIMLPTDIYQKLFPIESNDIFYVDGAKPTIKSVDYINGENANAYVSRPPKTVNRFTRIYLSERTE